MVQFAPNVQSKRREQEWKPHFFPKTFVREHKDITIDEFKLKEGKLQKIGVEITQYRKKLEVLAQNLTQLR